MCIHKHRQCIHVHVPVYPHTHDHVPMWSCIHEHMAVESHEEFYYALWTREHNSDMCCGPVCQVWLYAMGQCAEFVMRYDQYA